MIISIEKRFPFKRNVRACLSYFYIYLLKIIEQQNIFYYHKNKFFRSFKRKNTFIRKCEDGRNHGFGFKSPHQWPNEPEENTVPLHLLKGSRLTD